MSSSQFSQFLILFPLFLSAPTTAAHHLRRRLGGLFGRNPSLASAASAAPVGRSWCGRTAAMDESGSAPIFPNVRTPEDVFRDFRGRRAGIIKALTTGTPPLVPAVVFSFWILVRDS